MAHIAVTGCVDFVDVAHLMLPVFPIRAFIGFAADLSGDGAPGGVIKPNVEPKLRVLDELNVRLLEDASPCL